MPSLQEAYSWIRCRELLTRVCRRLLVEPPVHGVSYRCQFGSRLRTVQARIDQLWVVGDFALGATHCARVELVLQVTGLDGPVPANHSLLRQLAGQITDVVIHLGTPLSNSADRVFPEARLLWQPDRPYWFDAIKCIAASSAVH